MGTADLTDVEPGRSVQVENVPTVSLGVPEEGDPAALAGEWTVDLKAPEDSQAAEVDGLLMEITPPVTADPEAEVTVGVDYTSFADLYGPQAADRFGVVLLPNCVLDAPTEGECAPEPSAEETPDRATALMRPLAGKTELVHPKTTVEVRAAAEDEGETPGTRRVLSASVPVAELLGAGAGSKASGTMRADASAGTGSRAVGVLDTGASAAGDFTATPLQSSGSWAAGSSSGAFTYGYRVQVPETVGGLTPQVALSYSSQSVDGRTSATNNQASWVGDGWDYNAGSITRTYASCREDAKQAGANNSGHKTGDLCWGSDNATLTLGGATTELVWDAGEKEWFTANGDGSRIQVLKDTSKSNGDADGEYWIVTTTDGTKYHFGLNKLPGWSQGDPVTNSALTVPVFGNHAGEPCYKAGDWKNSDCKQAWRWNLDYVEDVHGNAMSLWWKKDTNHYARNFNWKAPVAYDRDGYLTHIDYGQRKNTVFSAEAPGRVTFNVAERCYAEGSLACTEANFTSKDPGKYRIWYDTQPTCGAPPARCAGTPHRRSGPPSAWTRSRRPRSGAPTPRPARWWTATSSSSPSPHCAPARTPLCGWRPSPAPATPARVPPTRA